MAQSAWTRLRRSGDGQTIFWLALVTAACAAVVLRWPGIWPVTIFVIPMVLGSLFLGPRHLPWVVVAVLTVLAGMILRQDDLESRTVIAIVVLFLLGLIILLSSFRRSRLGVAGSQGESMLVDLRDRLQSQGMLPALPIGWYAESALRSAGGTPFAGDFVVAVRPGSGHRLELAVVDVSGKG